MTEVTPPLRWCRSILEFLLLSYIAFIPFLKHPSPERFHRTPVLLWSSVFREASLHLVVENRDQTNCFHVRDLKKEENEEDKTQFIFPLVFLCLCGPLCSSVDFCTFHGPISVQSPDQREVNIYFVFSVKLLIVT